jgi:hypothetical protein
LVVHPLQHFLAEAPAVFDSDVYVTEKEFRQRFKVFCEENGYSQRIPWSKEFYGSVFEGKGIKLVTGKKLGHSKIKKIFFLMENSSLENSFVESNSKIMNNKDSSLILLLWLVFS